MTTQPTNTTGLVALLETQRALYRQLRELSTRQRDLISGDRPELLLGVLQDRQRLVSGLATVNEQLAPYRQDWEQIYAALPDDTRSAVADLVNEVNALLRAIIETDDEDGRLLAARKQAVSQSLRSVSDGRTAHRAYARQQQTAFVPKRDQHG